jgi:hypothetical protein
MIGRNTLRLAACCLFAATLASAQENAPELWYWHHSYLSSEDALAASKKLVNRAAQAGYTGVAFWDTGFFLLGQEFWPIANEERLHDLMKYAVSKHMNVMALAAPFGYSNDALEADPNWAESERITGAEFRVDRSGRRLDLINSFPGLKNGGFEAGKSAWFDTGDAAIGVSNTISHSGKNSGVIVDAAGNARFRQTITLKPWRQYHLRLYYKAQNFKGAPMLEVLDSNDYHKSLLVAYLNNSAAHDWMEADYAFDSRDTTRADLFFGVWGGCSGILWFDDVNLEETALVYVTRRPGAPLKVYDPANPSTVYHERSDYEYVFDPRMVSTRTPFTDSYHDPAPVKLPRSTHLKPGQIVAMDFYAAFPIPSAYGISMCMTDPGVLKWLHQDARSLKHLMPAEGSVLLSYDEIRQMNSCASCRAKGMTAGQLLAWSVGQSLAVYGTELPGKRFFIWNDMFDPYHNAVNNYYYVEGDLAGSWKGLPASLSILNWNLGKLHESLRWFSGLDSRQPVRHHQIIAGYYDSGNGAGAAKQELAAATGIPGIDGLMYTTWNNDYSQLESFAKAVRENWSTYAGSVPKQKAGAGILGFLLAGSYALVASVFVTARYRR